MTYKRFKFDKSKRLYLDPIRTLEPSDPKGLDPSMKI